MGLLLWPSVGYSGGGGSSALFTLDPGSPTLSSNGVAGDVFVDDSGTWPQENSLTLALPAMGLEPSGSANVDALSGGKDNGIPVMLMSGTMNSSLIIYQFSADRLTVDGVTGPLPIPFEPPVTIGQRPDFGEQFPDDQAADVFSNYPLVPPIDRWNFLPVREERLELIGSPPLPPAAIDNIDGFTSTGSLGGLPDEDGNGELDEGRNLYFSVGEGSGLDPATVYVKVGTNGPPSPEGPEEYATAAQLGLISDGPGGLPDDDMDAVSVWDADGDGEFDPGEDGVVFSLRAGSPSLPIVLDGIAIDEGGFFLALAGLGIVNGLPGGYLSLASGDELDGIHVVDPRSEIPPCIELRPGPVLAHESLVPSPFLVEAPAAQELVTVSLNDSERLPDAGGVVEFQITATIEDPAVAVITSATSFHCGTEGPPIGCSGCGFEPFPPCPGDTASFSARELEVPLQGSNLCLGRIGLEMSPVGRTTMTLRAVALGELGPIEVVDVEVVLGTTPSLVFSDGFESGDTSAWSSSFP